jgi:tetratricopeptide (TPR) repeat protein
MSESQYPAIDAETFIRWGKEAAQSGNKRRAYSYFSQALRLNPDDEEAWLWRGAMAPTAEESLECMRKALSLNPNSRRAWQGLEWAAERLAKERGQEVEEVEPLAAEGMPLPPEPQLSEAEAPFRPEPHPLGVEVPFGPIADSYLSPDEARQGWDWRPLALIALLVLIAIVVVVVRVL